MVIFGFILRIDHYGVSSFVRWLGLLPSSYHALLHFFRAESWQLGELMFQWMEWCYQSFDLVEINGRLICAGDGIKIPKEAKKQPGLKRLYNGSQNQNKPKHFTGHHFGCIAFIAYGKKQFRAILQAAQLHEGVDAIRQLEADRHNAPHEKESIVIRMLSLLVIIAMGQNKALYACLDAYFATGPTFSYAASHLMTNGQPWVHLITRAKSNYVAAVFLFEGKKKKVTFKLTHLFIHRQWFKKAPHPLHPERQVSFYCEDLYWGKEALHLRFVWVIDQGRCFILMSSDRSLEPMDILKIYGLRFHIEVAFRVLKHIMGGFGYRFWSTLYPVMNKEQLPMAWTENNPIAVNALNVLRAIERFVNLAIIAQGLLSYFALMQTQAIWQLHQAHSWLRSYSSTLPSEEVVQRIFQASFSLAIYRGFYVWIEKQSGKQLSNKTCSPLLNQDKVPIIRTLPHFLLN